MAYTISAMIMQRIGYWKGHFEMAHRELLDIVIGQQNIEANVYLWHHIRV